MNKIDYTPDQFIYDWLPDYQKQEYLFYCDFPRLEGTLLGCETFIKIKFKEAIENFAKAQREECLKNAKLIDVTIVEPYTMTSTDSDEVTHGFNKINTKGLDKDSILNAPMPEPIKNE